MSRSQLGFFLLVGTALAGRVHGQPDTNHESGQKPGHTITVTPEDQAVVGDVRAIALTIAPVQGHSISRDGPLQIELAVQPKGGLELPRRRYRRRHAADERASALRFDLAYRARRAGRYTMVANLRMWVCRKQICWPVRAVRRVPIEVGEPGAPNKPE